MNMSKLTVLLIVSLFAGCFDDNKSPVVNSKDSDTKDSIVKQADTLNKDSHIDSVDNHESIKPGVKVSAYLIYDDGTLSDFDVLNNDTVMLWNAVAGGGDVMKPSHSTKFIVTGEIDSLDIKVKRGGTLDVKNEVRKTSNKLEFVIKRTGCALVTINVTKSNRLILNDTINFHCGE